MDDSANLFSTQTSSHLDPSSPLSSKVSLDGSFLIEEEGRAPNTQQPSEIPSLVQPSADAQAATFDAFFATEFDNNPKDASELRLTQAPNSHIAESTPAAPEEPPSSHSMFISQNLEVSDGLRALLQTLAFDLSITHTGRFTSHSQAGAVQPLSSVIYYTINLNHAQYTVQRRYSEFASLRNALCRLFPTRFVPTLPEKHSFFNYLLGGNPTLQLKVNLGILKYRKRYLEQFLTQIITIKAYAPLKQCPVFIKFLDPSETNWAAVLAAPPMTLIPTSALHANPIAPTEGEGIRSLLPVPHASQVSAYAGTSVVVERRLSQSERYARDMSAALSKIDALHTRLITDYILLGGNLNNFALTIESSSSFDDPANHQLALVVEKFGSTIDKVFLHLEAFQDQQLRVAETAKIQIEAKVAELLHLLHFLKLKQVQLALVQKRVLDRLQRKEAIEARLDQSERLQEALLRGSELSPSIAEAIQRYERGERNWFSVFGGRRDRGKPTTGTLAEEEEEAKRHIETLSVELESLARLVAVSKADVLAVEEALAQTLAEEALAVQQDWLRTMRGVARNIRIASNDSLQVWQDLKRDVEAMV